MSLLGSSFDKIVREATEEKKIQARCLAHFDSECREGDWDETDEGSERYTLWINLLVAENALRKAQVAENALRKAQAAVLLYSDEYQAHVTAKRLLRSA